jgi:O-methyltransferase
MTSGPDDSARIAALEAENARLNRQLVAAEYERNSYRALLQAGGGPLAGFTSNKILTYLNDGLATWDKNVEFIGEPRFAAAYRRGVNSGHFLGGPSGEVQDIGVQWRVAISCWAGWHAARLPGDFVECGTNTGIMSLAVCDYVDFNRTQKSFFLFDTFAGVPADQLNDAERLAQGSELNAAYPECYELARRNFAPFPKAQLVRGRVPESLDAVAIDRVCYLQIDMNIEHPERAALAHFWPKLVPGGIVVFDDYGWLDHRGQKTSHDEFARSQGVEIFALPTGQGLLLKS